MGPPSSGGSTVGEALNILEGVPGYDALSDAEKYHWFLEASRFAFADRNVARRPGLLRRPAARAAVGVLRRRARAR